MNLLNEIRERRLPQWITAYIGGAWFVLQVVNLLSPQFGWTAYQQKSLTYLVAAAIAPVAILAWFHGRKGFQAFGGRELFVLGLLLLVLGFGLMHLNGRWSEEADLEFLGSARIRILSVDPPAGTLLKESDLIKGVPITVSIEQRFSDGWLNNAPKKRPSKPSIDLSIVYGGDIDTGTWTSMTVDRQESTWSTRQLSLKAVLTDFGITDGKLTLSVIMMSAPEKSENGEPLFGPVSPPVLIEYPVEPLETTSPPKSD